MADGQAGSGDTQSGKDHFTAGDAEVAKTTSDNQAAVEMRRAAMGLHAVLASDVAIAVAAILGVIIIRNDSPSSTAVVSILSSAFTAVGTLTTAYFGIKASANTAKNSIAKPTERPARLAELKPLIGSWTPTATRRRPPASDDRNRRQDGARCATALATS